MPRWDIPDVARRLDGILRDLRYARGDEVDRARAARVINRRSARTMTAVRFEELCEGQGGPMTAVEAVQVADGLGVDVRRLLYEEIPKRPERPDNIWDELDLMFGKAEL